MPQAQATSAVSPLFDLFEPAEARNVRHQAIAFAERL
jgi:hypothetical protein